MNIQIFGKAKCFDTKKAERWFKERRVKYQYVDLLAKGLSRGEFASVMAAVGLKDMIDTGAKEYKTLSMEYYGLRSTAEEVLFNNPKLYRTPIVRNGRQATIGYCPEIWAKWE
jgi:arsenate reductase